MLARVAQVLKDEGFIIDYHVGISEKDDQGANTFKTQADATGPKAVLRIFLKHGPEGQKVIREVHRASRSWRTGSL